MARKSGSIRVLMKLTSDSKVTSRRVRLKSAKNLCFGYRFFAEIRQIHRFFGVIRQKLQNLCRNQANPQILWCYQAKVTESLQKSGALDVSLAIQLQFSKRRTSRLAHHTRSSARLGALGPGSTGQLAFQCTRPDMLLSAQRMQKNHLLTCDF